MAINTLKQKTRNIKNLFFLSMIMVLASCNHLKLDKSTAPLDENPTVYHSKFSSIDSNQVANYESEDFASTALNNYTIAKISKEFSFLKCTKESVVNSYDSSVIDTIYTFSNRNNKIQIYRAKHNDFIFTFNVTDSKFKLNGNIKPGITKELFSRKFSITEAINNKVQIVNSNRTIMFMFYFESNRLIRISSDLYLD